MSTSEKAILCICADESTLRVRQMLLEHFGYVVLPTSSLQDAGAIAKNHCPDLLLMDQNHPGINIEDVAKEIKEICPKIIAVVLSPYFSFRKSPKGPVDRFIPKDDSPELLVREINLLLNV